MSTTSPSVATARSSAAPSPSLKRARCLPCRSSCATGRAEGQERLFPGLERDCYDGYTQSASRRCNTVIDRVNRDPTIVFHSFRNLFKDICRDAGTLECVNDQLTGHLPVTVGARYGRDVGLVTLAREIERLDFEFVEWEPILRASVP